MIKIEIRGLDDIGSKFISSLNRQLDRAVNQGCNLIRVEANRNLAPIDTGEMVNTSEVYNTNYTNGHQAEALYKAPYSYFVEVMDSYAHGAEYNMKYAYRISQGLDHLRKPEESAHFLGDTFDDKIDDVYGIIKEAVQRA